MSEDTAALVERVRRGFAEYDDGTEMVVDEAGSALDSLTAALERAERERDAVIAQAHRSGSSRWRQEKEYEAQIAAAEARAQKTEAVVEAAREFVGAASTYGQERAWRGRLEEALAALDKQEQT